MGCTEDNASTLAQEYTEYAVKKALYIMVRRGELRYSQQRKVLERCQP